MDDLNLESKDDLNMPSGPLADEAPLPSAPVEEAPVADPVPPSEDPVKSEEPAPAKDLSGFTSCFRCGVDEGNPRRPVRVVGNEKLCVVCCPEE